MKQKILIFLLTVSMLFSSNVYASESSAESKLDSDINYEQLLIKNGYNSEMVDNMDDNSKKIIGDALDENPENVDLQSTCMQIDSFGEMEEVLSIKEEDVSEDDLEYYKEYVKSIEELSEKSDKKLISENNMSKAQTKIFREIVEDSNAINDNKKNSEKEVTASGSISSSKLSYDQSVVNQSKNKKPKYTVCIVFTWKSPFEIGCFNDKICCAWGGNLATGYSAATAKYYDWYGVIYNRIWGKYKGNKVLKFEETAINKALIYSIPQGNGKGAKVKTGAMIFYLYQNTKNKGRATKVISRYCHKVISLKSDAISVSKSGISFSIGGAYDKSSQASSSITY